MGGQTQQNTQQATTTNPWAPASGTVASLLGQLGSINPNLTGAQTGAINALTALGAAGNPYAGQIGNTASSLLAGGGANNQAGALAGNLAAYQQQLSPYLQSSFLDPRNTPGFSDALAATNADITNQINQQFAAAGRDLSGQSTQALARGLSRADAQLIANQYNQNVANQLGAMAAGYGAGNTSGGLLSQLQQQAVGNELSGIGAAQQATGAQQYGPLLELQAQSALTGIPLQNLAAEMGVALPPAQAFSTQAGTGTTTTQVPLWQQIVGGGIGGIGLLGGTGAFGKNGWLNFGAGSGGGGNFPSSGAIY
jgi:hypothetical protein